MTVADLLKQAMQTKGWSATTLAAQASVDRIFVTRLLQADAPPPRQRAGRVGAERDERYHRLARALDLPVDAFVAQVQREQQATDPAEDERAEDRYLLAVWARYRALAGEDPGLALLKARMFNDVLPEVRYRARTNVGANSPEGASSASAHFLGTDIGRRAIELLADACAEVVDLVSPSTQIAFTRACYSLLGPQPVVWPDEIAIVDQAAPKGPA